MKKFFTLFLSLLIFSVMSAHNVGFDVGKDVIKQKIEFTKIVTQNKMDVNVTPCSESNFILKQNFKVQTTEVSHSAAIVTNLFDYRTPIYNSRWRDKNIYNKNIVTNIRNKKPPYNNMILRHNSAVRFSC